VEGAPTEKPRPDASNARSQRPATGAIGVSRALVCVCVKTASPMRQHARAITRVALVPKSTQSGDGARRSGVANTMLVAAGAG
jgi:hypothetical protein